MFSIKKVCYILITTALIVAVIIIGSFFLIRKNNSALISKVENNNTSLDITPSKYHDNTIGKDSKLELEFKNIETQLEVIELNLEYLKISSNTFNEEKRDKLLEGLETINHELKEIDNTLSKLRESLSK